MSIFVDGEFPGVSCDICKRTGITGVVYHEKGANFDACANCRDKCSGRKLSKLTRGIRNDVKGFVPLQRAGIKLVYAEDPFKNRLTYPEILARCSADIREKEARHHPALILGCPEELKTYYFRLAGVHGAKSFPRELDGPLLRITKSAQWIAYQEGVWTNHYMELSRDLLLNILDLLENKSVENLALFRIVVGLCCIKIKGNGGSPWRFPPWMTLLAQEESRKVVKAIQEANRTDSCDVRSVRASSLLRNHSLPGNWTCRDRGLTTDFRRMGFANLSYSSAFTNHKDITTLLKRYSQKGGQFECKFAQNFPCKDGRGLSVTCDLQMVVYSDLLATARVAKNYLDPVVKSFGRSVGVNVKCAPIKGAVRIIAKAEEMYSESQTGMVNIKDMVRYTINVKSMAKAGAILESLKQSLQGHAFELERSNKMEKDIQNVTAIYGIKLINLARAHPGFFTADLMKFISPDSYFMAEFQITTVTKDLAMGYSHALYEIVREASPSKKFMTLDSVIAPLGLASVDRK